MDALVIKPLAVARQIGARYRANCQSRWRGLRICR
jgi:hypothetical protein